MFDSLSTNEQVVQKKEDLILHYSDNEDIVGDCYRVQVHQPLSELSNEFVRYFLATHLESNQEFFAIVFERTFFPNFKMINAIIKHSQDSPFTKIHAISITRLSINKVKYIALIVDKYDYTNNLANNFKKIGLQNIKFILSNLLPFLCKLVQFADRHSLDIGNINPDNIIVSEDKLFLKEPYADYPHYFQNNAYLATELLDADAPGRQTNSSAADIYAAGVTMVVTCFNEVPAQEGLEKLKYARLNHNSFLATLGKKRLPDEIKNCIKGCLSDAVFERWKSRNLLEWASNKIHSAKNVQPNEISDIFAAVSFNGNNYDHYRSLASALYREWEAGLQFLSEERVLKWIQRSVGKSKVIELLEELTSREYSSTSQYAPALIDKEERLFKAIMVLDSQGPFRFNKFAAHLPGFSNMFHYAFSRQIKPIIDTIIKVSLRESWEDKQKYNVHEEFDHSVIFNLTQISAFYGSQTPGCGIERIVYHLNPALPCLSPLVFNEYYTSLRDLLYALEAIASKNPEKLIFDKHIISFIANKIGLKREEYVNIAKNFPSQGENTSISALIILVLALGHDGRMDLPSLATLLGRRVCEFIEKNLHNVKLKRMMEEKIKNASEESDLPVILKIASNPKVYQNDQAGYYKASRDISAINKKIAALTNNNDVKKFGTLFGQRITVLISYLIFLIIILCMVI